jgi:hypothetical protein
LFVFAALLQVCASGSLHFPASLFFSFIAATTARATKTATKTATRTTREQQTYQEQPEEPDKNENEVVSRGCFYFVFRFLCFGEETMKRP